nr:uncharacterized protein LOC122268987 [Parasteatoda tepidariorum]
MRTEMRLKLPDSIGRNFLGIKGPSSLISIPKFNVIQGFSTDSVHGIYLGVVKKLESLWFDITSCRQEYYIGNKSRTKVINKRTSSFIMPKPGGRTPRPIENRKSYNFLLYICLPSVTGLLPEKYFEHVSLLVGAVFKLLKKSTSKEELVIVDKFLVRFVVGMQELYGKVHMTFNVHSLLHITRSVLNWGSIWIRSMFVDEEKNSLLRKCCTGPTGIRSQITRKFLLQQQFSSPSILKSCSEPVVSYVSELHGNKRHAIQSTVSPVLLIGKPLKNIQIFFSNCENLTLYPKMIFCN